MGTIKRIQQLLAGIILLAGVAADGVAGEAQPQPPEDPQRRAQIEQWVKDLGSSDFSVREKAEARLKEAGEEAVFALMPVADGQDVEVADRAQALLEAAAWAPPQVQKEIEKQIELLKAARDKTEWADALLALHDLGKPARKRFAEICRTPQGEAELEMKMEGKQALWKTPVSYEITVTNTGETGFWFLPGRLQTNRIQKPFHNEVWGRQDVLEQEKQKMKTREGTTLVGDMRALLEEPPLIFLAPGETYVRKRELSPQTETNWVGVVELTATYDGVSRPVRHTKEHIRRMKPGYRFDHEAEKKQEAWPWFEPPKMYLRGKIERILLVPSFPETAKETPEVNGLTLTVEKTEPKREGMFSARLTWANRTGREITVPDYEKRSYEGIWYVVLDREGKVISGGGIPEKEEEEMFEEAAGRETVKIPAKESLKIEIEIPMPEEKGAHTLGFGVTADSPQNWMQGMLNNYMKGLGGLPKVGPDGQWTGKARPAGGAPRINRGVNMAPSPRDKNGEWEGILYSNLLRVSKPVDREAPGKQ